ncbi:MAG: hypothetical protein C0501_30995 [Isosphaera sp.]|nr:hypothetical protein [Isosphaera sp.]
MGAACLLVVGFVGLVVLNQTRLGFTCRANAYGSAFFRLEWAAVTAALIGLGLAATGFVRTVRADPHWRLFQALHAQMAAHFLLFVAAVGAVVFATLYVSPHVL